MKKFSYLIASAFAVSCCFSCGGGSKPGPEPLKESTTTVTASVATGETIAFEYISTSDVVVDWGDGNVEVNSIAHEYGFLEPGTEVTITIKGFISEIRFSSSEEPLADNELINKIVLGDAIPTLPERSFIGMQFSEITLGNKLQSIGDGAFYGCSKLNNIVIPASVKYMGETVFSSNMSSDFVIYCNAKQEPDGWVGWNTYEYPCYWDYKSLDTEDADFDYIINNSDGCYVIRHKRTSPTVEMPAEYKNHPVVGIAKKAFNDNDTTTEIKPSSNLRFIDEYAINNCTSLNKITLPNGLKTIKSNAFNSCTSLKNIIIPTSVIDIRQNAFSNCDQLIIYCRAKSKPSGWDDDWNSSRPYYWDCVEIASDDDFDYVINSSGGCYIVKCKTDKTEYDIKQFGNHPIIGIGKGVFKGKNDITKITLPDTLQFIQDDAFNNCSSLSEINIPKSVTTIGNGAFAGCSSLKELIIPISVINVGEFLFGVLPNLTIYCEAKTKPSGWADDWNFNNIPCFWDHVSHDEDETYAWVVMHSGTQIIQYKKTGESEVVIPSELGDPKKAVTSIYNEAFQSKNDITNVILPSTLKSIGSEAFSECSNLSQIIIPKDVTTIEKSAFASCGNLTIYCEAKTKPSGWADDWNSGRPCYWDYKSREEDEGFEYIIMNSGSCCISKYTGVKSDITIGKKYGTHPIIGIGERAFAERTTLQTIIIPNNITSIGKDAFIGCNNLTIYCQPQSKPSGWANDWNSGRPCYWDYKARGSNTDFDYIITNSDECYIIKHKTQSAEIILDTCDGYPIVGIDRGVFGYDDNITKVTLPNTLQFIKGDAFAYCPNLSEIIIPKSVQTISRNAFYFCSNLTIYCKAKEKPAGWEDGWKDHDCPCYWDYKSREEDEGFEYIIMNSGSCCISKYNGSESEITLTSYKDHPIVAIGGNAFKEKTTLTKINFPSTLQTIDLLAFYFCSNITELKIPKSVKYIGYNAFGYMDKLSSIDLTAYTDHFAQLPTADDEAFSQTYCTFEVASKNMAIAFMVEGGGWPIDVNRYHWPGK